MYIANVGAHADPAQLELALDTFDVLTATVLRNQDSAVRARLEENNGLEVVLKLPPSFDHGQVLQGGPLAVHGVFPDQLKHMKYGDLGNKLKRTVLGSLQRVTPLVVALRALKVVSASDCAILFHLDEARELTVSARALSNVFAVNEVVLQRAFFNNLHQVLRLSDQVMHFGVPRVRLTRFTDSIQSRIFTFLVHVLFEVHNEPH